MAPMFDVVDHVPAPVPLAGLVLSAILSAATIGVVSVCLVRRLLLLRNASWSKIPVVRWLIFAIYIDSLLFTVSTTILVWGFGLNKSIQICMAAIYMCLLCYMTTKMLIYYFLVEKVFIIRRVKTSRLKSKLYCFNCFGMLLPYAVIVVFNFIYRIARFDSSGTCIIGMEIKVLMPLIIFDAAINIYLTMLFIVPLRGLYTYKTSPDSRLRTIALRSFIGSCGTLTSSIANLTILMVLHGEAAWICLVCCNADVLFSVLVLHWVTSKDSTSDSSSLSGPSRSGKVEVFVNKLSNLGGKDHGGKNLSRRHLSQSAREDEPWEAPIGVTTTRIEGGRNGSIDDIYNVSKGGISVKTDHIVVVQHEDGSWANPRFHSIIEGKEVGYIVAVGSTGNLAERARGEQSGASTEELVEKIDQRPSP